MNILLDTNVLGRMVELGHPQCQLAHDAVDALRRRGDLPCLFPQVVYEFWVVSTRPTAQNGLGLPAGQADAEIAPMEKLFQLLDDVSGIYSQWRRLVSTHQVTGKR